MGLRRVVIETREAQYEIRNPVLGSDRFRAERALASGDPMVVTAR